MTALDPPQPDATTPRRPRGAALTAGWYGLVVAIVLNAPVFLWALLMAGLGLTMNDGPWWLWAAAVPFALVVLLIPVTLVVAFLWLWRRLQEGRPSLLLSGALALVGGSACFAMVAV